jgi:hypothetical protein
VWFLAGACASPLFRDTEAPHGHGLVNALSILEILEVNDKVYGEHADEQSRMSDHHKYLQ